MLNRFNFTRSLMMLMLIATSITVYSDKIQEWPERDGIDLKPVVQRFVGMFENEPNDLSHLVKGFQDCQLSDLKLGQLTGANEDILAFNAKANRDNIEVDVDLDINELKVSSTVIGCAALRKEEVQLLPHPYAKYYAISPYFKHEYLIQADYERVEKMTMELSGADDYKRKTHHVTVFNTLFSLPKQPINSVFGAETYTAHNSTMGSDFEYQVYSIGLIPLDEVNEGIKSVVLTRTQSHGKSSNSLTIKVIEAGVERFEMIGNHTLSTMLDGKMHGLNISDNYRYASDKTQEPYTFTCYDMGERVNVFKKTPNNTCVEVDEHQIGMTDVYVDQLYQIRQGIDNRRVTPVQQTVKTKPEHRTEPVEEAKKENEHLFVKKQTQAKCKLLNDNWAYLGTSCKNGLANGKGTAVDRQGLTFEGTFKAGNRIKGDIQQDSEMIFSGEFKDDKPDGSAICLFEGEYEECRFFRGKRIDTLYKIRKENAKNLAKMEAVQQERSAPSSQDNNDGDSNIVIDALGPEATKRAASFIFDQLF